jgi:hypothetical protein
MGLNPAVTILSLNHLRLNASNEKITHRATIKIGQRIRDIVALDNQRLVMALEGQSTPAIGILQSKKSIN